MNEEKRICIEINYEGTNGIKSVRGYGENFEKALINLAISLNEFENKFKNNNIENGGHTAFTSDAEEIIRQKQEIISQIGYLIGDDLIDYYRLRGYNEDEEE